MQRQSTEEFKNKVFNKYGNKVEILSEYLGNLNPVDIVYYCDKHGVCKKTINAKNVLNKTFQPCKDCASEIRSKKLKSVKKDPQYFYKKLKDIVESKGGTLISEKWTKSKDTYEIDCGNKEHPNFFNSADKIINSNQWCPYCCGRNGDFEKELRKIIKSKNGELLSKYKGNRKHVFIKCNLDGYIWSSIPSNIKKDRWCPICNIPYSERVVYNYLINNRYNTRVQYYFSDLRSENNCFLKFDFAILDKYSKVLGVLEVDDNEHRYNHKKERRIKSRERDLIKDNYCKDNNIQIFRLKFNKYDKNILNYDYYYNYIDKNIKYFLSSITKI